VRGRHGTRALYRAAAARRHPERHERHVEHLFLLHHGEKQPPPARTATPRMFSLPALPVSHFLASVFAQPPPAAHAHTIGVTAFAHFSSPILIPQLLDAAERGGCPHLNLLPGAFAKPFHAHSLPGISQHNACAAACAVEHARRRSPHTDAKFTIANCAAPKIKVREVAGSLAAALRSTALHPKPLCTH
jgi:hypothetical protein